MSGHGTINFGTPTAPNPDALSTPIGKSIGVPGDAASQILEKLGKLQTQQATDAATLLEVLESRTNQFLKRINKLENKVTGSVSREPEATPLVPDVPAEPAAPTLHPSLAKFSLENVVRNGLFSRMHFSNKDRGTVELQPDNLRWGPRDGFAKAQDQALEVVEGYVQRFLKTRKFSTTKTFRRKYPNVDFKAMGPFFSNAARGLNSLINKGI